MAAEEKVRSSWRSLERSYTLESSGHSDPVVRIVLGTAGTSKSRQAFDLEAAEKSLTARPQLSVSMVMANVTTSGWELSLETQVSHGLKGPQLLRISFLG